MFELSGNVCNFTDISRFIFLTGYEGVEDW